MINDICIGLSVSIILIVIISWAVYPLLMSKSLDKINDTLDDIRKEINKNE